MYFTLLLQPCGNVSFDIISRLQEDLESNVNVKVMVSTETITPPMLYYNWSRRQYLASEVLNWLYSRLENLGYDRILGVCNIDAYVPPLNFVFGLADPVKGVALVFLPRLKPEFYGEKRDFEKFYRRLFKEVLHELGHTFGLEHCTNRKCVMSFSNSILDVDFKEAAFCNKCVSRLSRVGIVVSNNLTLH